MARKTEVVQLRKPPADTNSVPSGEPALPVLVRKQVAPNGGSTVAGRMLAILKRLRYVPLVMAIAMTGGLIGMYFQPPGLKLVMRTLGITPGGGTSSPIAVPAPKRDPAAEAAAAAAKANRIVAALGKIVPEGDVRTVAPPFGAGDGRIAALKVVEGERVNAGDVLAVFDNEPQLQAAVAGAKATVAAREAALEQTRASVKASVEETRAQLRRAEATAENAKRDFERIDTLYKKGIATATSADQKRTTMEETAREVERLKATLSRWESVQLDQQPDVILALRNLDAAKADLARITAELDKAYARAPISGTVLTIHTRPGEKPGSSGIMTLGFIDQMTVEAEVYQTQIGFVAVGDPVEVSADSLPQKLTGVVTRIGLEVQRQTLVDPNPAALTDARVVKVYIKLEPPSSKIAQRYTNLQVVARIKVRGQSP